MYRLEDTHTNMDNIPHGQQTVPPSYCGGDSVMQILPILYSTQKIHLFLTLYSTQLLVQAIVLSHLDYCNSLLAGILPSAIRPLQLIQNAAARLVFNLPRHSHVTSLLTPLAACNGSHQIQNIGSHFPNS